METSEQDSGTIAEDSREAFHRVVTILRERIATRELPPGSKLLEVALAEEFGVSRARVREVLLVLEQRGLVERQPNRSAVVVKLDVTRVFELYDVREAVEGLCVRLAVEKTRPEAWADIVDLFHGPMEIFARSGDFESYLAETARFRARVIEAADNAVLKELSDTVYDKTRSIVDRTTLIPGRLEKGVRELQLVVAAMRRGDAEGAERLRRENIRSQRDDLRRYQKLIL